MNARIRVPHLIEALEPRIAPAVLASPLSVTYVDKDGDAVTISVSKGDLTNRVVFEGGFGNADSGPQQLLSINLASSRFSNADLTISVVTNGGDGYADFGLLNATNISLGKVNVLGSVNKIIAGSSPTTQAIASLDLHSLGNLTKLGAPDFKSVIKGSVGPVHITGDVYQSSLVVAGSIASLEISGSILGGDQASSGFISTTGNLGKLSFLSLQGGSQANTGRVNVSGNLGPVLYGGGIFGAAGPGSGVVEVKGNLESIEDTNFTDSLRGGSGIKSGSVLVHGSSGRMIFGPVSGGPELESGLIRVDKGVNEIFAASMVGGSGFRSGSIWVKGVLTKVQVGTLVGAAGELSGTIRGGALIGAVSINGSLNGGTGKNAGSISSVGGLADIVVGNSVTSAFGDGSGSITTSGKIGTLLVAGSVTGTSSHPVTISALGLPFFQPGDALSSTIESVTVNGSATFMNVMGGYDVNRKAGNADAQIGTVHVNGNFSGSNIVAGAILKNGAYRAIPGGSPILLSKIGNVIIDNMASSTSELDDLFKIVAQQVNRVSVNGTDVTLTPSAQNDHDIPVGAANDILIQEI